MAFTYFFRDMATLEALQRHAVPHLRGRMHIHIWDAGCAIGAEPYSLAMVLREAFGPFHFRNVRIHATDIDTTGEFAHTIASATYPADAIRRIPPRFFARYFAPAPHKPAHFTIKDEVRRAVAFHRHDLLSLRPIRTGLDLVVCKNVLLHFHEGQRAAVVRMFAEALAHGGFLAFEQTQGLPAGTEGLFQRVTPEAQLFRKVADPR